MRVDDPAHDGGFVLMLHLGLCLALARLSHPHHARGSGSARFGLRWPATVYLSFFRGTRCSCDPADPLRGDAAVSILFSPIISGDSARTLEAGARSLDLRRVALTLNSAFLHREVFRSGIPVAPRAASTPSRSLGLRPAQ